MLEEGTREAGFIVIEEEGFIVMEEEGFIVMEEEGFVKGEVFVEEEIDGPLTVFLSFPFIVTTVSTSNPRTSAEALT